MMNNIVVHDMSYPGLNPILFGYENNPKSDVFGPAVLNCWLIHYVVTGFGTFTINGWTHTIHPSEMFVIPPHVEVSYKSHDKFPWNYIRIGFTASSGLPKKLPPVIRCPEASDIFQQMKTCDSFSEGRSAFLTARLWDLFALLIGKEEGTTDYVQTALDYIHSEYMHKITVSDIASRLSLDRSHFSVLFKNKVGMSPGAYLLSHRMNMAASLMSEKGISVSVAAASVGYSEIYSFSKTFKRYFAISPTEYKRRHFQKKNNQKSSS